jgi:hypothetical protein
MQMPELEKGAVQGVGRSHTPELEKMNAGREDAKIRKKQIEGKRGKMSACCINCYGST